MFCLPVDDEIELGLLEPRHAKMVFALVDANRAHLRQWLGWLDDNTRPEHTRAFIQDSLEKFAHTQGFTCGIFYQGQLAGAIGTHRLDWESRMVEIGYWLAKERQGRGIVTRASRAILGYCFDELQLNRVQIRCATGNQRSCAIAERLGFTKEGILRQEGLLYDRYVDLVLYSLLAEEWAAD